MFKQLKQMPMMALFCAVFFVVSPNVYAGSAEELEIDVDATIERFNQRIQGGREFLGRAEGVLVFPNIVKAGLIIGGEYGEGALRVNGQTVAYYNTAAASLGLQAGGQTSSLIIVFMNDQALRNFRASDGWEVGVDGSVAVMDEGVGGSIDTTSIQDPIIAFAFGNKGLMLNLSLEGSKYTRIAK